MAEQTIFAFVCLSRGPFSAMDNLDKANTLVAEVFTRSKLRERFVFEQKLSHRSHSLTTGGGKMIQLIAFQLHQLLPVN